VNSKRDGTNYEYQFVARALKHNLDVFMPVGEHLPQDCLVMNGAGTIFKTQIKGTATMGCYKYKVMASTGNSSKTPLDCHKVDILVAYIEPFDIFYIIPCLALDGTLAPGFYPHNEKSRGKYERYKEAWGLFKA
jgi:hypothetical protein